MAKNSFVAEVTFNIYFGLIKVWPFGRIDHYIFLIQQPSNFRSAFGIAKLNANHIISKTAFSARPHPHNLLGNFVIQQF